MNWKIILKIQGFLLIVLSFMMMSALWVSLYFNGSDTKPIIYSIIITLSAGLIFSFTMKTDSTVKPREAFLIVSSGWIFASLFGALPFYFDGSFGSYVNCFFEAMSGFTTTGATILTDIESVPNGLLFWRSLTHWIGGMGIILLTIAVLPILGVTSGQLYNAEVPGPIKDRISPKIKDTAKILWLLYTGLTVLQTVLLMFGGMNLFEALSHTFSTLATGGFSTKNNSVAGFDSLYIEIIIIIFMYLAGVSFVLHYKLLRGNLRDFFKDSEWRFYTGMLLVSIVVISLNLFITATYRDGVSQEGLSVYAGKYFSALRDAAFTVVSITTTTGFCTADFNLWTSFAQIILIFLMFAGGCAGSTGGGIKQVRIMIILKKVISEIKILARPKAVFCVRVGKEGISDKMLKNVSAFVILFFLFFGLTAMFLTFMGYDLITSLSASIAALGNIGPGLARVGAIENYAFFDPFSKIVLSFAMLLGRLEIYSVLILVYTVLTRR